MRGTLDLILGMMGSCFEKGNDLMRFTFKDDLHVHIDFKEAGRPLRRLF